MRSGIITLLTDFGADGPYVAAMKGVILGRLPGARLVDISHAVPPQDVAHGGYVLAEVVTYFPAGTVHLAVVDPGVGTARRIVAVHGRNQWFVLPDNGLVAPSLAGHTPDGAWAVTNPALRLPEVSNTFHGRDVMAPAAAFLAGGGDPAELGPAVADLVRPAAPAPTRHADGGQAGVVVHVDPFGNLITNLPSPDPGMNVQLGDVVVPRVRTYGDAAPGDLVALVGSSGRVEIAVVNGSAAVRLGLGRGARVSLHPARE